MGPAMGYAAIFLMAEGTLGSYLSGTSQAKMQGRYYDFMANQAEEKAQLFKQEGERQSEYAQDEGARLSKQVIQNVKRIEGAQKTSMIAQGISLGSVTAEDITKDTLSKENLDLMAVRYMADLKAYEAKRAGMLQAMNAYYNAAGISLQGDMMSSATRQQAWNSLIGGAGQTASSGYLMFSDRGSKGYYDTETE